MDKNMFLNTIQEYKELGMSNLIDYDKFYLYSIVTHSTAIEGTCQGSHSYFLGCVEASFFDCDEKNWKGV